MKSRKGLFFITVIIIVLQATSLFAAGTGIDLSIGGGKSTFKQKTSTVSCSGGGWTIDSNLAKDNLFNYRLYIDFLFTTENVQIPFYRWLFSNHKPLSAILNIYNIQTVHSFGFGIIRTNVLRLWLGPQIVVGAIVSSANYDKGFFGGGGGIIGLNVNIGELFTLSLTGAVRGEGVYRIYRVEGLFGSSTIDESTYRVKWELHCGFIFRFNNDMYAQETRGRER